MVSSGRSISQQAFDAMVMENMEDLGMEPEEALEDAIETLTLQGVDLHGIVKCIPGSSSANDDPVIQSLEKLKILAGDLTSNGDSVDLEVLVEMLDKLHDLCSGGTGASDAASIAMRNGAVELFCTISKAVYGRQEKKPLASAFKAMSSVIRDLESTERFRQSGGVFLVMEILNGVPRDPEVMKSGFAVVAVAATGNEVLKEAFVDLKIDQLLVELLRERPDGIAESLFDAIRVLLTADDNRVAASNVDMTQVCNSIPITRVNRWLFTKLLEHQTKEGAQKARSLAFNKVFGYARRFARIGIANALVDALHQGLILPCLVSACIALKAVAVNDEICRSISEKGGIDVALRCIDDSDEFKNKGAIRACCSLLCQLAGSDDNKNAIIRKGGLDTLIKLSSRLSDDPSILQEIMSIIGVLSLRSPENAARSIEAGAGDMAIQAMQKFPAAYQMQRESCKMIRNLVVRNPENRTLLLGNGIENLIRKAKRSHESCKDAATAALRDLGLDDYNT